MNKFCRSVISKTLFQLFVHYKKLQVDGKRLISDDVRINTANAKWHRVEIVSWKRVSIIFFHHRRLVRVRP